MNLLAIDTSTELATVALAIGDELYSEEQGSQRQHAQVLLPMVERLLAAASVSLHQLDGIVFGRGPGSFTGLRVTCSIVKALAYAHDLPLYPVSSLAAIADEVFHTQPDLAHNTNVLAILDARMQQVYWGCFSRHDVLVNEQVTDARDVIMSSATPFMIAGVGIDTYASQLPEQALKQCVVYPQARAMIRLVKGGLIKKVSAAEALPVYVRELHFARVEGDTGG